MSAQNWSDLRARTISGVVLAAIALFAVVWGGTPYLFFVALCCGLMIWELSQIAVAKPIVSGILGALSAFGFVASGLIGAVGVVAVFCAVPVALLLSASRERLRVALHAVLVLGAGVSLLVLRGELGLIWLLWMIFVVISTDIAGYFVGRMVGGPKFWPAISPKKTWSGIVGGWVAAGVVGGLFDLRLVGPLVLLSVVLSFASQMGDIAESALKRRFGVKDSSNLIPGHGGFLDRFDALIAAAALVGLVSLFGMADLHGMQMGAGWHGR